MMITACRQAVILGWGMGEVNRRLLRYWLIIQFLALTKGLHCCFCSLSLNLTFSFVSVIYLAESAKREFIVHITGKLRDRTNFKCIFNLEVLIIAKRLFSVIASLILRGGWGNLNFRPTDIPSPSQKLCTIFHCFLLFLHRMPIPQLINVAKVERTHFMKISLAEFGGRWICNGISFSRWGHEGGHLKWSFFHVNHSLSTQFLVWQSFMFVIKPTRTWKKQRMREREKLRSVCICASALSPDKLSLNNTY